MESLVILVPEPHLAETNAMLHDLGWPEDNFTVALSVTGAAPKTHCGLRALVAAFCTAIDHKLARKPDLTAALIINTCSDKNRHQQFPSVVAAAGLQLILPQVD